MNVYNLNISDTSCPIFSYIVYDEDIMNITYTSSKKKLLKIHITLKDSDDNIIQEFVSQHSNKQLKFKFPPTNSLYCDKQQLHIDVFVLNNGKLEKQTTNCDIFLYRSSLINSIQTLRLIDMQMLDNDNNHVFCVFETGGNDIIISTLKQTANRKLSYVEQQITKQVPVFVTMSQLLFTSNNSSNYNISTPETEVLFTTNITTVNPISATISSIDYPSTHYIDRLSQYNTHP